MAIDADEVLNGYLATENGRKRDRNRAAKQLGKLLGLHAVGVQIVSAQLFGRGTRASANLNLSNGKTIVFESLRDFASPARLAAEIATHSGASPRLNGHKTIDALALLTSLADHCDTQTEDEIAAAWGAEFLYAAPSLVFDAEDQADRWRVFSELRELDPFRASELDRCSYAQACAVPVHHDGRRYVRCGWFNHFVKATEPISAQQIGVRMARVGWIKPGSEGRVHARCPDRPEQITMPFYIVLSGWLEGLVEETEL